ncbi:hypothetical protein WICMUC_004935 [Wickerhamomyces mucosus]|uniref:Transcription initiation factor IIE subunit beta n=1 Tax=Wickerhamomyces mucosus TaxID=1378264 RepID=A0A9P8PEB6_9ASCO|nr:hypothetical protein WICMUC_004935 [Wickerhamomyces mucosus]
MSNPLLANLNAFKNKVKSAPVLSQTRRISSPSTPSSISSSKSTNSQKRTISDKNKNDSSSSYLGGSDDDDDQDDDSYRLKKPAYDTTGSHLSTKLLLAVEYIKSKTTTIPVSSLLSYLSLNDPEQRIKLIGLIKNLPKIKYDPIEETLEYVSIHNIKTKAELINFLRSQATFKGISVKELKDGWNDALQVIKELEDEGLILVLKTKKDNQPRLVWTNVGDPLNLIDDEFVTIWNGVKLPPQAELPGLLKQRGLKPASVDPATVKNINNDTNSNLKKRKQRKGKVTNTHMTGILKDYSGKV